MRLSFIVTFIAISLLFHPNFLYANPGRTDSSEGHQDQKTGEYHYRSGSGDTLSSSSTFSSSNTSSGSNMSSNNNTSLSSNSLSTNNNSSENNSSSNSKFSSKNDEKQSSNKSSSSSDHLSSTKSNPISGYINLPDIAGYEVISNIPEKNDGCGKRVKVIEVIDGDTFKCIVDGKEVAIRLYGVDAPENGQNFSVESANYFKQLIDGKNVIIKIVENDRYGMVVALVYADKINVNEALIKKGTAWVYHQYCKLIFCNEWNSYEQIAKALKMSLWKERKPIPPWEYRQQ